MTTVPATPKFFCAHAKINPNWSTLIDLDKKLEDMSPTNIPGFVSKFVNEGGDGNSNPIG